MKKIRFFFRKITKKYKLVFLSADSLEERFSFITNRLYVFYTFLCVFLLGALIFLGLFFFTPVSNYFNTNNNTVEKKEFINLMNYTDSLELTINKQNQWINNFQSLIEGNIHAPNLDSATQNNLSPNIVNLDYLISKEDSIIRAYVEHEDDVLNSFNFFKPTTGRITDTFNINDSHHGVDIATKKLEKIYAVLDGDILISGQNLEFGNFMMISHVENMISIYLHADSFIKKSGEHVSGGEVIGFTGNTGSLSNGVHLHFELKHNGISINPEKYISF